MTAAPQRTHTHTQSPISQRAILHSCPWEWPHQRSASSGVCGTNVTNDGGKLISWGEGADFVCATLPLVQVRKKKETTQSGSFPVVILLIVVIVRATNFNRIVPLFSRVLIFSLTTLIESSSLVKEEEVAPLRAERTSEMTFTYSALDWPSNVRYFSNVSSCHLMSTLLDVNKKEFDMYHKRLWTSSTNPVHGDRTEGQWVQKIDVTLLSRVMKRLPTPVWSSLGQYCLC